MSKLIIDARERNVIRHMAELEGVITEIKQITVGDYVIAAPSGNILAIIERKSLEDFAASLKDGRSANKAKLTLLKDQTGCRIIYLIEGPEFPKPNDIFGGIPYKYIESSIFHLIIRDSICVLRSKDTLDTAKMLKRFISSMDTLGEDNVCPVYDGSADRPADSANPIDVAALLTAKHEKSDVDILRDIWSVFPGISTESASEYIARWTLADVVRGTVISDISAAKTFSGRAISKKVIAGISTITPLMQIKLLQKIPRLSHAVACALINSAALKDLLSYDANKLSAIIVGRQDTDKPRKLGNDIAQKIIKYFNYKQ